MEKRDYGVPIKIVLENEHVLKKAWMRFQRTTNRSEDIN